MPQNVLCLFVFLFLTLDSKQSMCIYFDLVIHLGAGQPLFQSQWDSLPVAGFNFVVQEVIISYLQCLVLQCSDWLKGMDIIAG